MTSESQLPAREQFGRQAAYYAISPAHRHGANLNVMQEYVEKNKFSKAIDIATGAGFMSFILSPQSDLVLATDITPSMLQQTRRLAGERGLTNVGQGLILAESMAFQDNSLDAVSCRTAPHHFQSIEAFLDEVVRVLRPGGVFLLADTVTPEEEEPADWMNDIELRRDNSHVRDWAPSEWLRAIHERGLEITDSAITRTDLEFNDWVLRSGTPADEVERLRKDFLGATPPVVEAFMIQPQESAEIKFSWPALVVRSVKPSV